MSRRQRAAQRSAAFECIVARAQADLDDIRRKRIDRRTPATATGASPPDVAALVTAELDRRAAAATAATEAAEAARFACPNGACTSTWVADSATVTSSASSGGTRHPSPRRRPAPPQ
jgi:hypothetical protein